MITVDTYSNDPRRIQPLKDAVDALREETDLESLVSVVGGPKAQDAVRNHQLPEFVAEIRD